MLKVSASSDVGIMRKLRSVNQDAIFVSPEPVGSLGNVFVIADGMGGHRGGEVASKTAIDHFLQSIRQNNDVPEEGVLDLLTSAAAYANEKIYIQAEEVPELNGMGTTFTACTISNRKCSIIHVGDSRTYALNNGILTQITSDHSYVSEMVKAGQITLAEAKAHPKRNILTQVLGIHPKLSADGYIYNAEPNSVILLCSDGLYTMVSDEDIINIINTAEEPASALVEAANNRGGADNISVIVVNID